MLVHIVCWKYKPDVPDADRFRTYLANLKGWVGVNGPYDFKTYPQRGLGPTAAVISRWDAEKQQWLGVSKPGGDPLGAH